MKIPVPAVSLMPVLLLSVAGLACGAAGEDPTDAEYAGEPSAVREQGTDPAAGADTATRQRLIMPAASRDLVLQEMRHMLEAVDGILDGVTAGDMDAVAAAAGKGGTEYAVDLDPAVADRLPGEFKELGMRTHRAFDDLASRARQGATGEQIIAGLGDLTGNCVGCHVSYRLDEARTGSAAKSAEPAPPVQDAAARELPPVNALVPNFYYEDVEAAKRWYVNMLGFRMVIDLGWVAIVELKPGLQVALVDGERGTLDAVEDKGALLVIETDALEEWHAHVSAIDGIEWYEYDDDPRRTRLESGIMEHPEIQEFRILDPGGYIIEFFRWKPEFEPR